MPIAQVKRERMPWLVLALAALLPSVSLAATVTDLYSVTVPADRAAEDPRADAIQRAMIEVVTRVTGSRALAQGPEIEPLLGAAARYVESFGYSTASEALVRFIPSSVERALTDLNLPVWGVERPLTVFWIAVTDQFGDRALVSSGEIEAGIPYGDNMRRAVETFQAEIADATRARGLPYVLPLLDVRDLASVDFLDVWNFELGVLADASARFGADAIAVARVRESEIGSDVAWVVRMGFDQRSLPGASLQQGIDWLADTYAAQYASVGGARPMLVRVTGVADFRSYARTMSYLEDLSLLDRVDVESFRDGELMLRIHSRGDAGVLGRVLSLGGVLRESRSFNTPTGLTSVLDLELVRNDPFR